MSEAIGYLRVTAVAQNDSASPPGIPSPARCIENEHPLAAPRVWQSPGCLRRPYWPVCGGGVGAAGAGAGFLSSPPKAAPICLAALLAALTGAAMAFAVLLASFAAALSLVLSLQPCVVAICGLLQVVCCVTGAAGATGDACATGATGAAAAAGASDAAGAVAAAGASGAAGAAEAWRVAGAGADWPVPVAGRLSGSAATSPVVPSVNEGCGAGVWALAVPAASHDIVRPMVQSWRGLNILMLVGSSLSSLKHEGAKARDRAYER